MAELFAAGCRQSRGRPWSWCGRTSKPAGHGQGQGQSVRRGSVPIVGGSARAGPPQTGFTRRHTRTLEHAAFHSMSMSIHARRGNGP